MDNEQIWRTVLGELEVALSKANFTTWFKDTFIISSDNNSVTLGVPNAFTKEWLSNKYHAQILEILKKISPHIEQIHYKIVANKASIDIKKPASQNTAEPSVSNHAPTQNNNSGTLNSKYVFETFIVSNTNRLAHASSMAVAANPGVTYNPLFIYGGVGLGKTHLLHAIGNEILRKWPDKKVVYLPCEKFTNDFISSISSGTVNEFKKTYRNVDVLLVDDIQFLSNKEGFQEEFLLP